MTYFTLQAIQRDSHGVMLSEGKQTYDVVGALSWKSINGEMETESEREQYEGTRSLDTKPLRDEDADDYHPYIKNLPREEFLPADLERCIGVGR